MDRKAHCKECIEKIGNDWFCVHRWLDQTARDYWPWVGHRQIRHHAEGVEEVRKQWGDEAAKAAELHIISDEGYVPSKEQIKKKYGRSPFNEDNGEYPYYPHKRYKDFDGVAQIN